MLAINWKQYWLFYLILGLFFLTLIFGIILYSKWDNPVDDDGVEVNLPIIEWVKYTNLSKQLPSDTINEKISP